MSRDLPTRTSGQIVDDPFGRTYADLDDWLRRQGSSLHKEALKLLPPLPHHLLVDVIDGMKLNKTSKRSYLKTATEFVALAGEDSTGWTPAAAADFYDQLRARTSTSSANSTFSRLRSISRHWALRYGGPDFAGLINLEKVKDRKTSQTGLTFEEGKRLLTACDTPTAKQRVDQSLMSARDRALIAVGLQTGMRSFSLVGIDLLDIKHTDPAEVEVQLQRGRRFTVPLSSHAWTATTDLIKTLDRCGIRSGRVFRAFTSNGGFTARISERGIWRIIHDRLSLAGLDRSAHVFPRTFSTWARELGATEEEISAVTGNTLASSTRLVTRVSQPASPSRVSELLEAIAERLS